MNNKYVAGFAFNKDLTAVVMVEKQKPAWQKGKLNAVGGKIEKTDWSPLIAMEREFKEETGVSVSAHRWKLLTSLTDNLDFIVHFYYSILENDEFYNVKTMEMEEIKIILLDDMNLFDRINNIDLLIDMVLYLNGDGKGFSFI